MLNRRQRKQKQPLPVRAFEGIIASSLLLATLGNTASPAYGWNLPWSTAAEAAVPVEPFILAGESTPALLPETFAELQPPAVDPGATYDYDTAVSAGFDAYGRQEYQAALTYFQRALQARPSDPYVMNAIENTQNRLFPEQAGDIALETAIAGNNQYSPLAKLLKNQQWLEADQETTRLLLIMTGTPAPGPMSPDAIAALPCGTMMRLDHLWRQASDGQLGFGVQTRLWQDAGRPLAYNEDWLTFGELVVWQADGYWGRRSQLKQTAPMPVGHWPSAHSYIGDRAGLRPGNRRPNWPGGAFFQRLQTCGLPAGQGTYGRLQRLLDAADWQAANAETAYLIASARQKGQPDNQSRLSVSLDYSDVPCDTLAEVDQRWRAASDDQFGLSVQKQIWQAAGRPSVNFASEASAVQQFDNFRLQLGWPKMFDDAGSEARERWSPEIYEVPPGYYPYEFPFGQIYVRLSACGL